jgi:uncharacterized protein YciI
MKYLILTTRTDNFQQEVIPLHYQFLDELRAKNQLEMFGPFTDKSGGAYIIKASSLKEAEEIAFRDPIYTSKSSMVKVYEWDVKI